LEPVVASLDAADLVRRLDAVLAKAGPAAPLVLFLASFLEYVFPPVPGDAVAVLGGWYATHGGLSWAVLFSALSLGALAGTAFDWRLGRWLGARLDHRAAVGRLDRDRLERFERAYRRWGGLLLVANRFLPGIRAFFFLAAGATGIPLWKVLLYGGISAALWNVLLLGAGAMLAKNETELLSLFARYDTVAWIVLVAGCAIAIFVWLRRRARRQRV
jgi:membrane protein DedA with SNARE-associated domain